MCDRLPDLDSRQVVRVTSCATRGNARISDIMIARNRDRRLTSSAAKHLHILAIFVSMLAAPIERGSSQVPLPQSGNPATSVAYPDTQEGLRLLLLDAVAAAKHDDEARVDQIVKSLVIPDYKQWFAETLSGSGSWAEAYETQLNSPTFGVYLKCRLHELARRNGTIVVDRKPDNELGSNRKPLDVYQAQWRDEGGSPKAEPQWNDHFVWAKGGFRWYSIWHRAVLSNIPLRMILPAAPQYPYPVDGRHPGGIVRVSFVVRSDGSVAHVKPNGSPESSTDPKLIRAATDAVKRVRFMPLTQVTPKEVPFVDIGVLVSPWGP